MDNSYNPDEELTLTIRYTGSSVDFLPSASEITYSISVLCEDDLSTSYTPTTFDAWQGNLTSRTGELTDGDGEYRFTDSSFGT